MRVGRMLRRNRSVYQRANGTYWFRSGSERKTVHGAQLWTTIGGVRMRGSRPLHVNMHVSSDEDSDDELQVALALSLDMSAAVTADNGDESDDDLFAAIALSLGTSGVPEDTSSRADPDATRCTVCMESVENGRRLRCGHEFHARCLQQWLRRSRTCPLCRARA